MKKTLALVLVVVMMMTCLAGCGKSNEASNGKVTLHIGLPSGKSLTPIEIVEEFKKANPDINVTTDEAPWGDFVSKLNMQIAANNAPDVFFTDSGHASSIASKGVLMNLADKIKEDLNCEDYISAINALSDAEGNVWGIPHAINSTALYYNEELFDKAGLDYPDETWTWQDVLDAAKKLTSPQKSDGTSDVYGLGHTPYITIGWLPLILATDGAPLDEAREKSKFDDPKTIEGIHKFEEIVKSGITPPLAWVTNKGGMVAAFCQGNIAMSIMQSNAVNSITVNAPDLRFNVTNIPYGWDGNRDTVYVPNMWVVNGRTTKEKQEAAWKWLKYYYSEEVQLKLAEKCLGGYPLHKKALEFCGTKEGTPSNKTVFFNELDTTGVTLFENATWSAWSAQAEAVFTDLYNGTITADEAAKILHERVSKELK